MENENKELSFEEQPTPSVEPVVQAPVEVPVPAVEPTVQAPVEQPAPIIEPVVQAPVEVPAPSVEPTVQTPVEQPAPEIDFGNTVIVEPVSNNEENPAPVEPVVSNTNTGKKKSGKGFIVIIAILAVILVGLLCVLLFKDKLMGNSNTTTISGNKYKSEYRMSGNSLENFDLYFLKLENEKKNKIYSPLSIKYALEMLLEGAEGDSKAQIEAVIGDYEARKYTNSENMSFANSMFIKETIKESIKSDYTEKIRNKFDAEIVFDSFENANSINAWVKNKTLNLLDNLVDDQTVQDLDFVLINALAIDMEWVNKIQPVGMNSWSASYPHENYGTYVSSLTSGGYTNLTFDETQEAKSVKIGASINNYDIVKTLGEENIRETVRKKYQEFIDKGECTIEYDVDAYLDKYIEEINSGYGEYSSSTDFMVYTDDNVKVFAKNLKEYNGTTLQYVGIMPVNQSLYDYVEKVDAKDINTIISNLKEIKSENFKEGAITKIEGTIPLFKFEDNLKLLEDLKELGITDVFDRDKANLSKLSEPVNKMFISKAIHKANIEFSNEGVKASAATALGGWGAGGGCSFEYLYDVPVEEIDLTFDKPYMYIIRDKSTGEVWFTGTVYEPIKYVRPNGNYAE